MLYRMMEFSDLFVDACIRDESGQLMFLSLYGRDTAILQFLATFSLKDTSGGLSTFRLTPSDGNSTVIERVHVSAADRLQKLSGRMPNDNLFGSLVHAWIYDPVLVHPDRPNKTGWVMLNTERDRSIEQGNAVSAEIFPGIWELYKTLSTVPLLDHWMNDVLEETRDCVRLMSDSSYPPIGNITAARVTMDETFPQTISRMVRSGAIGLESYKSSRCGGEACNSLENV